MTNFSLNTNIDALIEAEQQKLQQLMEVKQQQEAKLVALETINQEFTSIYDKYGVSENEYYLSVADKLEAWIIDSEGTPLYQSLAKHFERAAAKAEKAAIKAEKADKADDSDIAPEKVSTLPKPKLKVGTYRNPATGETVQKVKRSPKILDQWIEEYGFAIVRTWKID